MRVAVLGGGIQGVCVALELASRGVRVDLYDKNEQTLTRASLHNEGKIHLGYLYGNDPTFKTANLMMRGALSFAPLLRRWIGGEMDKLPISSPYYYLVPKSSLLSAEQVTQHFLACSELAQSMDVADDSYFGRDFRGAPQPVSGFDALFDSQTVVAAFQSQEIAISADRLCHFLREQVRRTPEITSVLSTTVRDVQRHDAYVDVCFDSEDEQAGIERYDHVVNALWEGRLVIDATAGLLPEQSWLFRLRYNLHIQSTPDHPSLNSVSIMLGPYGDIVRYSNGEAFLSWYPVGLRGTSSELAPPQWPDTVTGAEAERLAGGIVTGLSGFVFGLHDLAPHRLPGAHVAGGVIFAWASSDIDDPQSELHTRHRVGPVSRGRYHSIDTGKLTTAPLFAEITAKRILSYES